MSASFGWRALAVLAFHLYPNGLGAIEAMRHSRDRLLLISIFEWNYGRRGPRVLQPDDVATAAVLLWARHRVPFRDWLLVTVLGGASAMALRNIVFIAFIGPVLMATYLPVWRWKVFPVLEYAAGGLLVLWIEQGSSAAPRCSYGRQTGGTRARRPIF